MIDRREIMEFSREWGLTANVIEKEAHRVLVWVKRRLEAEKHVIK